MSSTRTTNGIKSNRIKNRLDSYSNRSTVLHEPDSTAAVVRSFKNFTLSAPSCVDVDYHLCRPDAVNYSFIAGARGTAIVCHRFQYRHATMSNDHRHLYTGVVIRVAVDDRQLSKLIVRVE